MQPLSKNKNMLSYQFLIILPLIIAKIEVQSK